jgi:SAM-dependent methyltransferase/NAD(P)-dependent dehydrogenase (short-subunit alcohol dehydrogenase family)/acyl carrier protein
VRFADGLRALTAKDGPAGPAAVLMEVGPGRTLATFAAVTARGSGRDALCLTSLPGSDDQRAETELMLSSLGQLWASGVPVDWEGLHRTERRVRVSLPAYPFERRSYWIGPNPAKAAGEAKKARDTSKWFHRPIWRVAPPGKEVGSALQAHRILVLDEETGLGAAVAQRLREARGRPIVVRRGAAFVRRAEDEFILNPAEPDDYRRLAAEVCAGDTRLAGVVDCWGAAPPGGTELDEAALTILLSPMRLAHALGAHTTLRPLPMLLAARGTTRVHDDDALDAVRALGIGPAKVLPQEHPGLRLVHVDVDGDPAVAGQLLAELAAGASEPAVALRGGRRFVEAFEPVTIANIAAAVGLPERPVVMITGGLGHMGMYLAEAIFEHAQARLVLLGRSQLPAPEDWAALSEDPGTSTEQRLLLGRLAKMRARRDEVLTLAADLNDGAQVRAAVDAAMGHFGQVDLLVHGAARIDAAAFGSAAETGLEVVEAQFSPKLRGLFHVIEAFRGREPRRWVLHSSISSVLGGLGLAAYSGVNAMLDTLALAGGSSWLSLDWDAWDNAGEAKSPGMPLPIQPAEGQQAFLRALGVDVGQRLIVVVNDLAARLRAWVRHDEAAAKPGAGVERHPRPNLSTAFIAPRTDTERALADIWGAQLGVDRVGIHDRFFDLGGHSLLAVQVASEIRDRFEIELPVLKLFQAPTVGELAVLVEQAQTNAANAPGGAAQPVSPPPVTASIGAVPVAPKLEGSAPGTAAKASYREFYDDVTRRLERSGVGDVSFFLNYGYLSLGGDDEARHEVPAGTFNPSSVRLAFELIGGTDLKDRQVLDVGCGRGGTVALLAEACQAEATGVDLSPEAIAFCRRTHRHPRVRFEVGDAEHLPFDDAAFEAVTNVESSHTYPNLRAFLAEVRRVLASGGWFLYTDLLPVQRWAEVRALLDPLGLTLVADRHITPNVLASCDEVAATRAQAFNESSAAIDNFLAVPGSAVYEQMRSGAWEYRILRARRR